MLAVVWHRGCSVPRNGTDRQEVPSRYGTMPEDGGPGLAVPLRLSVPLVSSYTLGVVNLSALTSIERLTQVLTFLNFLCALLCSLALVLYTNTVANLDTQIY